ncbi:lysozyme inhibitor LprI family protein [Bradyrhizobium sp. Ec3.3]|uniref:lysozyme inhibitor LprI family protein n=1 Tax=Bradyrhizobium sp. Ec3.3 TaxID=189753 RepID=UPI00040D7EA9|nr:lysozyme inhibitor LprI family protein [Bradyrhizobium sp. Ec3.3]
MATTNGTGRRHHRAREAALTKASIGIFCIGVILLLASRGQAIAEDVRVKGCFDRRSNAEQRDCLHDLYRAAQAELDQLYRQTIEDKTVREAEARAQNPLPPGSSWAERIAASQKAWEGYREAECWGVVGQPGGSGSRTWAYGCLAEKTFERISELKVPFDQR